MKFKFPHIILVLAIVLPAVLQSQTLDVGIYYGHEPKAAWIKIENGTYTLFGDQRQLTMIDTSSSLFIQWKTSGASVKVDEQVFKNLNAIHLIARSYKSELRIKPDDNSLKEHIYEGSLKWTKKNGYTQMINMIDIEKYTAGVVESESGREQNLEYYKVQSIICRTYALSNIRKHEDEGFELCDQVHCQVYHGKARFNPDIQKAADATHGYVLVDSDINLVTAAFHSNCGGHTINSEHVWSKPLPYLTGRQDTFCLTMPHAIWEKQIEISEWESYMKKHAREESAAPLLSRQPLPGSRENYLEYESYEIPMKRVRSDWNLPSAFFTLETKKDSIELTGKGFGHGVGLCQEGAMRMSQLDYTYREILHFYYDSVHLIKLSTLDFFRDKEPETLED
ncbi:SpoIID/LytB domain-containing protein [Halocola ammonii]